MNIITVQIVALKLRKDKRVQTVIPNILILVIMQKCKNCGTSIDDNINFCWKCGKSTHEENNHHSTPNTALNEENNQKTPPFKSVSIIEDDDQEIKFNRKKPHNNDTFIVTLSVISLLLVLVAIIATIKLLSMMGGGIERESGILIIPGIILFLNLLLASWIYGIARALNPSENENGWLINTLQLFGVLSIILGIVGIASISGKDNSLANIGIVEGFLILLYILVFAFISFGIAEILYRKK